MIYVTNSIRIDEGEIHEDFIRASGPGGQNVNKVATAVKLRFDVKNSPSLPEDVRKRLIRLAGNRITGDGVLVIDARRFRRQEKNRKDAINRLVEIVREAVKKPKKRRKTRPTRASKERRFASKRKRSLLKQQRRSVGRFDE